MPRRSASSTIDRILFGRRHLKRAGRITSAAWRGDCRAVATTAITPILFYYFQYIIKMPLIDSFSGRASVYRRRGTALS